MRSLALDASLLRGGTLCIMLAIAALCTSAQAESDQLRMRFACYKADVGGDLSTADRNVVVIVEQSEEPGLSAEHFLPGNTDYHSTHNTRDSPFDVYMYFDVAAVIGARAADLSLEELAE